MANLRGMFQEHAEEEESTTSSSTTPSPDRADLLRGLVKDLVYQHTRQMAKDLERLTAGHGQHHATLQELEADIETWREELNNRVSQARTQTLVESLTLYSLQTQTSLIWKSNVTDLLLKDKDALSGHLTDVAGEHAREERYRDDLNQALNDVSDLVEEAFSESADNEAGVRALDAKLVNFMVNDVS